MGGRPPLDLERPQEHSLALPLVVLLAGLRSALRPGLKTVKLS